MVRFENEQDIVANMYDCGEADLKELTDPTLREPFERAFRHRVENAITVARDEFASAVNRYEMAALLHHSLQNTKYHRFSHWITREGILLGDETCWNIGTQICQEQHFTAQEAAQLMEMLRLQVEQKHSKGSRHLF